MQAARPLSQSLEPCSPPLFVFGASYMDVGDNAVAWPLRSRSYFEPYGLDFFGKPTGRYSNGRLVIDYISQGLGQELMNPYLRDVGSFRHGVNFASAGSTTMKHTFFEGETFSLLDQRCWSKSTGAALRFPAPEDFALGVYIIETGNNDYLFPMESMFDPAKVSTVMESIAESLRVLYSEGARTFVVMDIVPVGCFHDNIHDGDDEDGCALSIEKVLAQHNAGLRVKAAKLNAELPGANMVVFSIHGVFMSAIRNPSKFGLKYVHKACCGSFEMACGQSGIVDGVLVPLNYTVCENRSEYMLWDSLHPTDAFAYHIAQAFLSGEHMQPSFHIREMCRLHKFSL